MSFLKDFFQGHAQQLIKSGGEVIDTIATSDEEKLTAKQKLSAIIFNTLGKLQESQSKIILSETNGNWLQRSWRPISMLGFLLIVMYSRLFAPAFGLPAVEIETELWELIKLGFGGFVIGRSTEKVAGILTKGVDLPFLRKKDRDKYYG